MTLITPNMFAAMLFGELLLNRIFDPARRRLHNWTSANTQFLKRGRSAMRAHG